MGCSIGGLKGTTIFVTAFFIKPWAPILLVSASIHTNITQ